MPNATKRSTCAPTSACVCMCMCLSLHACVCVFNCLSVSAAVCMCVCVPVCSQHVLRTLLDVGLWVILKSAWLCRRCRCSLLAAQSTPLPVLSLTEFSLATKLRCAALPLALMFVFIYIEIIYYYFLRTSFFALVISWFTDMCIYFLLTLGGPSAFT